jgi:hypothetical protein
MASQRLQSLLVRTSQSITLCNLNWGVLEGDCRGRYYSKYYVLRPILAAPPYPGSEAVAAHIQAYVLRFGSRRDGDIR